MEDEEDKEPFAFIQKNRLLFRQGHSNQSANLDSGIGHTVRYTKSGRQLATRLGLCIRSGLPVRAETASTCWVFTLNSFVLNLILEFFVVDSLRKEIVAGSRATFLEFRLRNTKVILIAVFRVGCICCYCRYYCCTI